ncbi:unnamed protein product [Peronospora belbahrii]|uniref:Peptidase S1 domain-containing protein n=1 Tax=Peronospora belbahrii TaxID=622444 RepID=A0ABN8D9S8_9STRA|nr:unnamed protein product [Peronospora belbahrii]
MSTVCTRGEEDKYLCNDDIGVPLIKTKSNKGSDDDNCSNDAKKSYDDAKDSYDAKDSGDVLIGLSRSNTNSACRDKGLSFVYSRVSSALAWINSVTEVNDFNDKGFES